MIYVLKIIMNRCDEFLKTKNIQLFPSDEYSEIENIETINANITKLNEIYSSEN